MQKRIISYPDNKDFLVVKRINTESWSKVVAASSDWQKKAIEYFSGQVEQDIYFNIESIFQNVLMKKSFGKMYTHGTCVVNAQGLVRGIALLMLDTASVNQGLYLQYIAVDPEICRLKNKGHTALMLLQDVLRVAIKKYEEKHGEFVDPDDIVLTSMLVTESSQCFFSRQHSFILKENKQGQLLKISYVAAQQWLYHFDLLDK